jgi:4-amino-4-deoxy-L-arabinose transferase-like glycosyltransferase
MLARGRPLRLIAYAILASLLYLPGLGRPALWEPDEGRYGEIAREMALTRDYVTPRDDFELYFEKPPLVYWAEAAAIDVFGVNEFAVRFPAALFSVGQVVVTAALAEVMFNATAGFLAAVVLALMPLFYGFAKFATLDPALALFLTAALAAFYLAARDGPFSRASARNWMMLSAAMLALGTLAKGPVALMLAGAIVVVWLAMEGRLREIAQMPLVSCFVIYAVIVLPWFVLMEARNPGFLTFFFIHEHLQRYVSSTEHGWGLWFFIPIVIGGAWPWIFFVPLGWSAMRVEDVSQSDRRSAANFLAIWFVVVFVFFSIPRSKLGSYILPALPPLAIIVGYGLARVSALEPAARHRLFAAVAMANLLLGAGIVIFSEHALAPINPALDFDGLLIAVALAVGSSTAYVLARAPSLSRYAVAALTIATLATVPLSARMREDASSISTYRNLASAARPYLTDDCTLASYRHYVQSLPFYTDHRETRVEYWGELSEVPSKTSNGSPFLIGSEARLRDAWASGKCMVLIANARDLPSLQTSLKPAPVIIGCEGKKFALYHGPLAAPPAAEACLNSQVEHR